MEELMYFGDVVVLITTAANRGECQAWQWWDDAHVVIQVDERGAKVLKGAMPA